MAVTEGTLRSMIYEGLGGRRFTQASPILPDVWMAFGMDPFEAQELLLGPHRDAGAEFIGHRIRTAVEQERKHSAGRRGRQPKKSPRAAPRIACIPELIAARLYFDEMIRIVLTRTAWWRAQRAGLRAAVTGLDTRDGPPEVPQLLEVIAARIDALAGAKGHSGIVARGEALSPDFLWLVSLIGTIWLSTRGNVRVLPDGSRVAAAFGELLEDHLAQALHPLGSEAQPADESNTNAIWTVSLNRRVEPAVMQSALAIKADAARLLFNISCRRITWAVIDSGIDARHPAFWDWSDPTPPKHGESKPSRVDRTYDFTGVRDLLEPSYVAQLFNDRHANEAQRAVRARLQQSLAQMGEPDPATAAPRRARQLRERLMQGLEIDWEVLEPMLRVHSPEPPISGHGTHVAGVLGADWRVPRETGQVSGEGNPVETYEVRLEGICPDIRLVDMRVLAGDASDEFEVICALQFIAHLNRRADSRLISGVNLSVSSVHKVDNHACGSTPICEACDRLWGSGVLLVAAAGNNGHQRYQLMDGRELGGYHSISITDPGNAEGVITVGATHYKAHQYGVSYFSSRGPTGDGRLKPDLVAPGEGIVGPLPGNAEGLGNGTSFAAPHVSGAAALLMARFEELRGRPDRIKEILCCTATDLRRERYFQGAGMTDILRALQSI